MVGTAEAGQQQCRRCYHRWLFADRSSLQQGNRRSEERYALAVRGANDGLWDWDLAANRVYYAPRWKSILGYEDAQIGDSIMEWFNRVHPVDVERVKAEVSEHLAGKTRHLETEHRMLHDDGTYRWVLTPRACRARPKREGRADGRLSV